VGVIKVIANISSIVVFNFQVSI